MEICSYESRWNFKERRMLRSLNNSEQRSKFKIFLGSEDSKLLNRKAANEVQWITAEELASLQWSRLWISYWILMIENVFRENIQRLA